MGMRYRSITKIGKGKYITSSYSMKDYLIGTILMWIFFYPIYYIFKFLFIYPIKWTINKIKNK